MKTTHVLVDYENVPLKALPTLNVESCRVHVFLGPNNRKLNADFAEALQPFGDRAKYVRLEKSSKNALDFHIAFYLGKLAAQHAGDRFLIVSKDTGFDTLLEHLCEEKIDAIRVVTLDEAAAAKPIAVPLATPKKVQVPPAGTAAKSKKLVDYASMSTKELAKLAWGKLIKRKDKKPGTRKKLLSTLTADFAKQLDDQKLSEVVSQLEKSGHLKIDEKKVSYE